MRRIKDFILLILPASFLLSAGLPFRAYAAEAVPDALIWEGELAEAQWWPEDAEAAQEWEDDAAEDAAYWDAEPAEEGADIAEDTEELADIVDDAAPEEEALSADIQATAKPVVVTAGKEGNELEIYTFLTERMGFHAAAASGILANLFCESKFIPDAVGDRGTSYGICQWHNGRRSSLLKYLSDNGYEEDALIGQLFYLQKELSGPYAEVYRYLTDVPDTAEGAFDAARYFCIHYEVPKSRYTAAKIRGNLAKNTYWEAYAENIENPTVLVQLIREEGARSVSSAGMRAYLREEGRSPVLHEDHAEASDEEGSAEEEISNADEPAEPVEEDDEAKETSARLPELLRGCLLNRRITEQREEHG